MSYGHHSQARTVVGHADVPTGFFQPLDRASVWPYGRGMSSVEDPKSPSTGAESHSGCCEKPMRDWYVAAEKCAREEPMKCTAIAFLAGFVFTILPVGQIIGGLVRLILGLVRPGLVILGAMKVFEEIEKRRQR